MTVRILLIAFLFLAFPLRTEAASYTVQPGDTLSAIAAREQTSLAALAAANGLRDPNFIRVGTVLTIPGNSTSASTDSGQYRVRSGDTLTGLSVRFGTSVAALRSLNPSLGPYLLIGQWVRVCASCNVGVSQVASATSSGAGPSTLYAVQPGDTLSRIAVRFGISVAAILTANAVSNPNLIVAGTRLAIPGVNSSSTAASVATGGDVPALIRTYASYYGLNPSLALGISWQESGFNQSLVSPTGAIGVMQVEPYTGVVISRLLGRQLNLYQLQDNIQAGVFWLSYLLQYYGGVSSSAVAAYYQGSQSIALHGLFDDTVLYVRDVLALQGRFGG